MTRIQTLQTESKFKGRL